MPLSGNSDWEIGRTVGNVGRISASSFSRRNALKNRRHRPRGKVLDFDALDIEKKLMEATPPPTPPSPPLPRARERNWWQRNWKWFVPTGCFTLFVLFVVFIASIMLLVFGALKSSDVYKTAVARAKADDRVVAALGRPIHEGMFTTGNTNVSGGFRGGQLSPSTSRPHRQRNPHYLSSTVP